MHNIDDQTIGTLCHV